MFEEILYDPMTGIARKCARYKSSIIAIDQYTKEKLCRHLGGSCDCLHKCIIKKEIGVAGVKYDRRPW